MFIMSNLPHVGGALGRDSQSRLVFSRQRIRGEAADDGAFDPLPIRLAVTQPAHFPCPRNGTLCNSRLNRFRFLPVRFNRWLTLFAFSSLRPKSFNDVLASPD